MTNKEKFFLKKKDLSARLPYRVKVHIDGFRGGILTGIESDRFNTDNGINYPIDLCKAYLRPMSSMTEEESAELSNIISEWFDKELFYLTEEPFLEYALSKINYSISHELFDWLNAHHFDYRGLIKLGLALEAPEDMYN